MQLKEGLVSWPSGAFSLLFQEDGLGGSSSKTRPKLILEHLSTFLTMLCSVHCSVLHCIALSTVNMYYTLSVHFPLHCVLYTVYFTLCTAHCVLYTVYCIMCTVHCVLYTVYCTLCTEQCVLNNVYWTLCTEHCPVYIYSAFIQ